MSKDNTVKCYSRLVLSLIWRNELKDVTCITSLPAEGMGEEICPIEERVVIINQS